MTVEGLFKIISVTRIFLIFELCTRGGHHLSNVKKAFQHHKQSLILIKQQPSGKVWNPYLFCVVFFLLYLTLVEIFFFNLKVHNTKQLLFDLKHVLNYKLFLRLLLQTTVANQHHPTRHAHNHCCTGWVKSYPTGLGRAHSHYPISSSCDLRIEDGGCPGKAQVIPQCSGILNEFYGHLRNILF